MQYKSNRMELEEIRLVYSGKVNDVVICREKNGMSDSYYTLLVIKNHWTARQALCIYEKAEPGCQSSLIEIFSEGEQFYLVFAYREERRLEDFFMEKEYSLADCEQMGRKLVLACMESALPYPFLYLALVQKQVHLAADGRIYLGFQLCLDDLDEGKTEADCAEQCAWYAVFLLEKKRRKEWFPAAVSLQLLQKKEQHGAYGTLAELYQDIGAAAFSVKRKKDCDVQKLQDRMFSVLFVISVAVGIALILILVLQLLSGGKPFIWFFAFRQIGTESLLQ